MLKDVKTDITRRAQDALRNRNLVDEYVEWLSTLFPWEWWGTITLRDPFSARSASGLAKLRRYIQRLQRSAGAPIMAAVAESYGDGGRLHFLVLIAGVAHLSIDWWRDKAVREFGSTKFALFDGTRNACRYFVQNAFARSGELHLEGDMRSKRAPVKNPAVRLPR